MATYGTLISLTHKTPTLIRGRRGRAMLRIAVNKMMAALLGTERGLNVTVQASTTALVTGMAQACTAGISASGTGTVGITINGTTGVTATWATSDTVSAGLIAAAVNASTSNRLQYLVGCTNLKSTLTLASVLAGTQISIAGFNFTAIAGATESYKDGEFTIGGTDTQDGTSLCAAINRHPAASRFLFALNEAGACHVFPKTQTGAWFTAPDSPPNLVTCGAATVTIGSATFVASAYYGVWAKGSAPGVVGNCFTVAAVGTGQSIENSNTRLTRGLGISAEPYTDTL